MKIIRIIILQLMLLTGGVAIGQNIKVKETRYRWEGSLYAGLNNDGYELDAGVTYFFNRFIGVRGGFGLTSEIGEISGVINWTDSNEIPDWYYDDDDDDTLCRLRFTPSLVFRSPCVLDWKNQDVQIYLFAEPGLVLATPVYGSRNSCWLSMMLRAGLNMQIDRLVLTLGYGVTNYSLTSGMREYENPDHITHTVFIGAGFKF